MAKKELNVEIGQLYEVNSKLMKGKDGVDYPVFTMLASGRAWASRQYFTGGEKSTDKLTVKVLERETYGGLTTKGLLVQLISGGDFAAWKFNKSPYVKKDGSFQVIVSDLSGGTDDNFNRMNANEGNTVVTGFKSVYGVTKLGEDWQWKVQQGDTMTYLDRYFKKYVEDGTVVKGGPIVYLMVLEVEQSQLTKL